MSIGRMLSSQPLTLECRWDRTKILAVTVSLIRATEITLDTTSDMIYMSMIQLGGLYSYIAVNEFCSQHQVYMLVVPLYQIQATADNV